MKSIRLFILAAFALLLITGVHAKTQKDTGEPGILCDYHNKRVCENTSCKRLFVYPPLEDFLKENCMNPVCLQNSDTCCRPANMESAETIEEKTEEADENHGMFYFLISWIRLMVELL